MNKFFLFGCLWLSVSLSGCAGWLDSIVSNKKPVADENTPVVGTGEIDVYYVDFEKDNGALKSLYSRPNESVKRDRYVSLILHSTYLVDLPELFGEREYKVAFTVTSGDKQATRIIDGIFEPPGRLNFRDFPLLLDVVYTGKPINIKMDIVEIDEKNKELWKEYIKLAGGVFGIGSKIFFPGGDTITQIANGIVDIALQDDSNQFPFNITLHEADTSSFNTVSPLLDSKYVFSTLRTDTDPQVWTPENFKQKVSLNNGKLYNQGNEFRARSYLIVTVRAKDKRISYSEEEFARVYRKATGFAAQVVDWGNGRFGDRALAALDDAQEMLNQQLGVLTHRDIDARRFFFNTKRFLWLAAKVPCDSYGEDKECRDTTRIYFRNALDNFLRIPENSFPTDDITENDYKIVKEYLCGSEVKKYLLPQEWNEKTSKICVHPSHEAGIMVFAHHIYPPPIWMASNHLYPPPAESRDLKEDACCDGEIQASSARDDLKNERAIYTPEFRQDKKDARSMNDESNILKDKKRIQHHIDPPPMP